MAAILPVLRWPGPVAVVALVCAAGARGGEDPAAAPSGPAAEAPHSQPAPPASGPVATKRRPGRKPKKAKVTGVLNLNRATEAELQLLPGVGKGRARAIVERRPKAGYRSVDEVARIKGLGRLVQRLRKHLATDGVTTLRPLEKEPSRGPAG